MKCPQPWSSHAAIELNVYQIVFLIRSRLRGRLGWYRYRLRMRVRRLALYWYALPYRPGGPGHARDVDAWRQLTIEE